MKEILQQRVLLTLFPTLLFFSIIYFQNYSYLGEYSLLLAYYFILDSLIACGYNYIVVNDILRNRESATLGEMVSLRLTLIVLIFIFYNFFFITTLFELNADLNTVMVVAFFNTFKCSRFLREADGDIHIVQKNEIYALVPAALIRIFLVYISVEPRYVFLSLVVDVIFYLYLDRAFISKSFVLKFPKLANFRRSFLYLLGTFSNISINKLGVILIGGSTGTYDAGVFTVVQRVYDFILGVNINYLQKKYPIMVSKELHFKTLLIFSTKVTSCVIIVSICILLFGRTDYLDRFELSTILELSMLMSLSAPLVLFNTFSSKILNYMKRDVYVILRSLIIALVMLPCSVYLVTEIGSLGFIFTLSLANLILAVLNIRILTKFYSEELMGSD